MQPPQPLRRGPGFLRKWLNSLLGFARESRILRGPNYDVHETPAGTVLDFRTSSGSAASFTSTPFQVISGGGSGASVKVSYNSWLLEDAVPTSKITISGLDSAFSISAGNRIWLEIDLSATYSETPGPITASIQHGTTWGGALGFFPIPVEYNTDDGTRLSSGGTPPANTKQTKIFIPIAYCTTKEADTSGLVAKGFATAVADDVYIIQQCSTHLMLGGACIDGGTVAFALPSPYAPQPA